MAVAYVVPKGVAQDLDALAALLAAEPNISAAVEIIDVPEAMLGRMAVKVTGTVGADITNAIAQIDGGDGAELLSGTAIV